MPKIKNVFIWKNGIEKEVYPGGVFHTITYVYEIYNFTTLSDTVTITQTVRDWVTPTPVYPAWTDIDDFEWFNTPIVPATADATYYWTFRTIPAWVYYNSSAWLFTMSKDGENRKTFKDRDEWASSAKWIWTFKKVSAWKAQWPNFPDVGNWWYVPSNWYWWKKQWIAPDAVQGILENLSSSYNAITLLWLQASTYVTAETQSGDRSKNMCDSNWKIYDWGTSASDFDTYARLAKTTPDVPNITSWTKIL